nr:immunoglobulin light chain junction region [Mus musculus]NSL97938.1 immunoglobulin light chain junction region [Mus musculus]NSL98167.1 immunoglobulin light chain junction region [Mus musculus]NSM00380.1 immunoglobulin light chain junction region [Mus musculus]NSM00663.1 immunoglobulin light chain junction region [Mus musculus]
CQHSWEIPYTF